LKSQAADMETHGIPNDILPEISAITTMICLPIIQKIVYPALRKAQIPFRPVSRITLRFCFKATAMGYAALVQHILNNSGPRYDAPLACSASEYGTILNHVSVFIQIPIYVLEGLGGIFAIPAMLEVAYVIAPKSMKSMIQALFTLTGAVSSLMGIALLPLYKDPRLVITYSLLSALMFITMIAFQWFFGRSKKLS
jgi:proton-dependent oligopeptide transporter, POT family